MVREALQSHHPDHLDAYEQEILASRCELAISRTISRIGASSAVPEQESNCLVQLGLMLSEAYETCEGLISPVTTKMGSKTFISCPRITDGGLERLGTIREVFSPIRGLALDLGKVGRSIEKLRNSCSSLSEGNIPPAKDLGELEKFVRAWGNFHHRINHPGCGHAGGW